MENADQLADQAVEGATRLVRRTTAFTTRLLLGVLVIVVGGFALGVAALSGGIETVWIVLGAVFGSIAIGAAFTARWRVGSVRRHIPQLADEIRSMIKRDSASGRVVVDTFAFDADDGGANDGGGSRSVMVFGREASGMRGLAGHGAASSERVAAAVTAFTSLPLLAFLAIGIAMVFGFLGFIFLIALAL